MAVVEALGQPEALGAPLPEPEPAALPAAALAVPPPPAPLPEVAPLGDPLGGALGVSVPAREPDGEPVALPAPLPLGAAVGGPDALPVPLPDSDRVGVGVGVGVREPVLDKEAPRVAVEEGVPLLDGVGEGDRVPLRLGDGLPLREGVPVGVAEPVPVGVAEPVPVGERELGGEGAPLLLKLAPGGVREGLGEGVGEPLRVPVPLEVGKGEGVGEEEGGGGKGEGVGEALRVAVGEAVMETVGEAMGEAVGVAVSEAVGEGLRGHTRVSWRSRALSLSATSSAPLGASAMLPGLNRARAAGPSKKPEVLPASTVRHVATPRPPGAPVSREILLVVPPCTSVTNRASASAEASDARELGPERLRAHVSRVPLRCALRIALFPKSAISTKGPTTARPRAPFNRPKPKGPSTLPVRASAPATVLTFASTKPRAASTLRSAELVPT